MTISELKAVRNMKLKEIRAFIAEDATDYSFEKMEQILKDGHTVLIYSYGIYGMNGALFQTKDGTFYKIIGRSTNLWII